MPIRHVVSTALIVALATACASSPMEEAVAPAEPVVASVDAATSVDAVTDEADDAEAVVALGTTLLEAARTGGDALQRALGSRGRGAYDDCAPAWAHELLDVAEEDGLTVTAGGDLSHIEVGAVTVPVEVVGSTVLLASEPCIDEPLPQPVRAAPSPPARSTPRAPSTTPAPTAAPGPVAVPDASQTAPPEADSDPSWWRAELDQWAGLLWDVHRLNESTNASVLGGRKAAELYEQQLRIVEDAQRYFARLVPPAEYADASAALLAGLEAWVTELWAASACAYQPSDPCEGRAELRTARGEAFRRVEAATGVDLPD